MIYYLVNRLNTQIASRIYLDLQNFAAHGCIFWYANKPQILACRIKLATCSEKQQLIQTCTPYFRNFEGSFKEKGLSGVNNGTDRTSEGQSRPPVTRRPNLHTDYCLTLTAYLTEVTREFLQP